MTTANDTITEPAPIKKGTATTGTNPPFRCPNCQEIWTASEKAVKECFRCGYPNHNPDDNLLETAPN